MKTSRRWAAVVIWMFVIFILSSIPGDNIPEIGPPGVDKVIHFIEFLILAILLIRALRPSFPNQSLTKLIILSITIAALYGATDELHQYFISKRTPDFFDFVFDFIGATIGAIVYGRR